MKSLRVVLPLLLTAALAVTALTASSAVATASARKPSGATTFDRSGDVYFTSKIAGAITVPGGKATQQRNGDIRTVRVKHTANEVRVRVRFVELAKTGSQHLHVVQVLTSKGKAYEADVYAGPGAWKGVGQLVTGAGSAKKCKLAWKLDYAANTALVTIPRSCLGKPTWIRAGAGMSSLSGNTQFADDGLSAQKPKESLTLGPKLYR